MKKHGQITVQPEIPAELARLPELAFNLYWSWSPPARAMFRLIDRELFERVQSSPVALLREVPSARLAELTRDEAFMSSYRTVLADFDAYMRTGAAGSGAADGDVYAYFCAEYGWHESIPIYSGGLGVLAGDHTKAASDLGVPLVAVGLWYPEGYFHQRVAADGTQEAVNIRLSPGDLPLERSVTPDGTVAEVTVVMFGRTVRVQAWTVRVGRVTAYLLDTDLPGNDPRDREYLSRLYGGDHETRIAQEMVLGVGGVRMLKVLGVDPSAWHMNEGHSAFMVLERSRQLVQQGLSFAEAREAVAGNTLFTVHTPVAAGNDAFSFELVRECFGDWFEELGLNWEGFIALASADQGWGDAFSMPALALRNSSGRNGVAQLHGETSRRIWSSLWPGTVLTEVPVHHVTNGVHRSTWMARDVQAMLDRTLGPDWRHVSNGREYFEAVRGIGDEEFWEVRRRLKEQSLRFLRRRLASQLRRNHASLNAQNAARSLFDPEALTIGFARRFATYKRATLIFTDLDRLERLLRDPERPVQLVFAGKAHPADQPGQALIQRIHQLSLEPRFRGRILFVEDYDMAVGRALTRGVDVWLNNPRRPLEASGTSGEKAAMNGVLNLSVLDGWWPEGFDGENGWAFGMTEDTDDRGVVDARDAEALYSLLEKEVVPLFYDRDAHGRPTGWLDRSRAAIASIAPGFSARRMVRDYVEKFYAPASERGRVFSTDSFDAARSLAAWRGEAEVAFAAARVNADVSVNGSVQVDARVSGVPVELSLRVRLWYAPAGTADDSEDLYWHDLAEAGGQDGERVFSADFQPVINGRLDYGIQVTPVHPLLSEVADSGLNTWA